ATGAAGGGVGGGPSGIADGGAGAAVDGGATGAGPAPVDGPGAVWIWLSGGTFGATGGAGG
ncbi:hypothetical protein, partial [Mycolicibacterium phlei]|uniref:hypothetical protein n=1 Tax=Mycolicibacterium phlei TaxID=1771 RepID=UPI003BB0DF15